MRPPRGGSRIFLRRGAPLRNDVTDRCEKHERLPKSKMASSDDSFMFEIVPVLRFGNGLNKTLLQIYHYKSSTITSKMFR